MHPTTHPMCVESAAAIDRGYRWCRALARSHYENFPVASWLLPRRLRDPVAAIYAFARSADDIDTAFSSARSLASRSDCAFASA